MQSSVRIMAGDNRQSLAALPENSVDAVVTDPPYNLTSITKRFGKEGSKPARADAGAENDGSFGRVSGGFMGKAWDATGIERDPEFWADVYRVLKPGGFVFAFSGSRTGHRQACAMEQAGFVLHPMHVWIYGQGFPKGHDASKAIDRHLGTLGQREVTATGVEAKRFAPGATVVKEGGYRKREDEDGNEQTFTATNEQGGSPEAQQWDGWKYGTQTQKPAMEPIYLGQKPYDGKPVESILKWGVGAFNIDGCRVAGGKNVPASVPRGKDGTSLSGSADGSLRWETGSEAGHTPDIGRYPANVLHDGSDEVVALFPDSAGQIADESTRPGRKKTEVSPSRPRMSAGRRYTDAGGTNFAALPGRRHGDTGTGGSAARFFNCFPADEFPWPLAFYHGKAGKADRAYHLVDKDGGEKPHPTVKPVGLLRHLVRHICRPGGTILDPFAGTGTTAVAANAEGVNCILMEAEPEYIEFLRRRFADSSEIYGATDSTTVNSVDLVGFDDLLG